MDFHKFIEKNFGGWSWRTLFIAFVAMLGATFILDYIISKQFYEAEIHSILQHSNSTSNEHIRWLDRNDVRAFSHVANSPAQGSIFGIGWVSASSISIRKAPVEWRINRKSGYELTEVMSRSLASINEQPVSVHRYLLQGARSTDIRRAVLNAANDPTIDFLLIPVSPIYFANDHLAFTNSYQRASSIGAPYAEQVDYQVAATVLSPLEIAMGSLVKYVGGFRYREKLKKSLNLSDMQAMLLKKGGGRTDGAAMRYWQRWLFKKNYFGSTPSNFPKNLIGYRNIALMQNLDEDGLGRRLFQANIRTASTSGKPTLFYFPPLHPKVSEDPSLVNFYANMANVMENDIQAYGGPNVKFHGDMLLDLDGAYEHLDIIHLSHGQGVIDVLLEVLRSEFDYKIEVRDNDLVYGRN